MTVELVDILDGEVIIVKRTTRVWWAPWRKKTQMFVGEWVHWDYYPSKKLRVVADKYIIRELMDFHSRYKRADRTNQVSGPMGKKVANINALIYKDD